MRSSLRFIAVLLIGAAGLTWLADRVLTRTTRRWFESDVAMREKLAVGSAREALVERWESGDQKGLTRLLQDIAVDERINAAAACDNSRTMLARSDAYPAALSCERILKAPGAHGAPAPFLSEVIAQEGGDEVQVGAVALYDGTQLLGTVILVHDLGYAARREDRARAILLTVFALLAGAASVVLLLAARFAQRGWIPELQRLLLLGPDGPLEHVPLLRDVVELVQRVSAPRDAGPQKDGLWSAGRLRELLATELRGERVVVLSNREPYIHDKSAQGETRVLHPASGLVTALEPVLRACAGVWVAHGSGNADKANTDARGHLQVPPGENAYLLRRVWLSEAEEEGYYYGFSNEALWPLCHLADARPIFRAENWERYREVNKKFADAVCEEVKGDDPIILIQDYHFALAPRMIRQRLPRATIIGFWHIPWPSAERFGICPWRAELVEGLLGCSIMGFHTQLHCNNFLDAVDSFIESRIDRVQHAVVQGKRSTQVRPYPISIEWPLSFAASIPDGAACRKEIFALLGLGPDALLGVGVDRLDYTKGIEERLLAVERLLERTPALIGRFTFAQLAAPSRTRIPRYAALNDEVTALAARINQRFQRSGWQPIRLLLSHHEPTSVFRFYRAADVCYVSSLHDGMNLVAKEFVAAREDERGVLVLSQFTGASHELTEALIVNPYDLEAASGALDLALRMSPVEQQERMRAMRAHLSDANVYRWAARMLIDAEQLRRGERLRYRLNENGAKA
jgi:trehalose 6-phosphate synthase